MFVQLLTEVGAAGASGLCAAPRAVMEVFVTGTDHVMIQNHATVENSAAVYTLRKNSAHLTKSAVSCLIFIMF